MQNRVIQTAIFIAVTSGLFGLSEKPVKAQEEVSRVPVRDVIKRKPKPSAVSAPRNKPKPKAVKVVAESNSTQRKRSKPTAIKTGDLVVSALNSAEITLQSSVKDATPRVKTVAKEGSVQWENLSPGIYTVTAEIDGFVPEETEVELKPDEVRSINFDLKPITYQLTISTNVSDGEVRYAPLTSAGTNPDGTPRKLAVTGYCIVPINNGKAQIKELKKGDYNFDIRAKAPEYRVFELFISLPRDGDDLDDDDSTEKKIISVEKKILSVELERQQSTTTFSTAWSGSDWTTPAAWKLDGSNNGLKVSSASGLALPRNESYRHYIDFEMISNIRLLNAGTAGFVVRALDNQNYYLIQISGEKADEPYLMQGFVVKSGKAEPLSSSSIQTFASNLTSNVQVIIKGENNAFTVFIENQDGEKVPLGKITDPASNFKIGAVGIAGESNSNFQVSFFKICTPSCQ